MPEYDIWVGDGHEKHSERPLETCWEADSAFEAAQEFLDDQGDEWSIDGAVGLIVQRSDKSEPPVEIIGARSGGWRLETDLTKDAIDVLVPAAPVVEEVPPEEPFPELSPRRRQVALMLARGRERKEIAAELGCAVATIDRHKLDVMKALGVRNTAELALLAVRRGYVVP